MRAGFIIELSRLVYLRLNRERKGLEEAKDNTKGLLALIDRLYSAQYDFREYSTVVIIASGFGITGHILYIKDLITGNLYYTVQTQCIFLV